MSDAYIKAKAYLHKECSAYDPPVRCRGANCKALLEFLLLEKHEWKVSCPKCGRYEGRTFEDEPYNHEHYWGGIR